MGKVAFNQSKGGISVTYTPWLKDLVNDVYLASLAGYYKVDDELQAITVPYVISVLVISSLPMTSVTT